MTRRRLIVDTATTGLWPELGHELWEVATLDPASGKEHLWRVRPEMMLAEPEALEINHYRKVAASMAPVVSTGACDLAGVSDAGSMLWSDPDALAMHLYGALRDVTLIGAVPGFDERFLSPFLREHGYGPPYPWHYRVKDICSMAYGYLTACMALGVPGRDAALGVPDMDSGTDDFARALGVDPDQFDRHSALGDCRLIQDMLKVIEGRPGVTPGG